MNKKKAKEILNYLNNNRDKLLIIHYSCQGLHDENDGYSPMITSIVVHNIANNISMSFSIHLEAELKQIPKDEIEEKYAELEKNMLRKFFHFIKNNNGSLCLHWNMRNINYGFEAIEHRYKVLGADEKEIFNIEDSHRFNLSDLILAIYGENCVKKEERMYRLMVLNGGTPKDVMSGKAEADAFKDKEYVKLHKSTLNKVLWFNDIYLLLLDRKIKTDKSPLIFKINNICDHIIFKILGALSILITVFGAAIWLLKYFLT